MNKSQLIDAIAPHAGSKKTASEALDALIDVIQNTVAAGEKVALVGFGTFEKAERPARDARNPATGETIHVAARSVVKFKPGADFRATVASGGTHARAAAS